AGPVRDITDHPGEEGDRDQGDRALTHGATVSEHLPCEAARITLRAMPYVALITGASSGIGEATARRLARERHGKLVLMARRETRREARIEQLAGDLGGGTVIAADLTEPDAPNHVRQIVEREHGGELHLLVNNAGAAWRGTFAEKGWANVERHMKLNFEAPVR